VKFALAALLFILAPGCNQQTPENLSSEEHPPPQATAQKQVDDIVESIMDQGFYGGSQSQDEGIVGAAAERHNAPNDFWGVETGSTKSVVGVFLVPRTVLTKLCRRKLTA
jgi:hypothetical protein